MTKQCLLTTIDNPYNPFTDFKQWFVYDVMCGYNTCGKIARNANYTSSMMQFEQEEEFQRAIDKVIEYDFLGQYIKVTADSYTTASANT